MAPRELLASRKDAKPEHRRTLPSGMGERFFPLHSRPAGLGGPERRKELTDPERNLRALSASYELGRDPFFFFPVIAARALGSCSSLFHSSVLLKLPLRSPSRSCEQARSLKKLLITRLRFAPSTSVSSPQFCPPLPTGPLDLYHGGRLRGEEAADTAEEVNC